jgi:hypothetical protein
LELDHVLIAVGDLEAAGDLPSVPGGRHPGWGTANRIVPLGETYLELIAVVDPAEAARTPFGRWVAASHGLLGWAVRTGDIDAVAARLQLDVGGGSRVRGDGRVLSWRLAGVEQAVAEPHLPFFIQWGEGTELPGSGGGAFRLAGLELRGDPARLAEWLGDHELPVEIADGEPAVTRVVLSGPDGRMEIRPPYTVV